MKMWIRFISYEQSVGKLKSVYDRVAGGRKTVDNILQAHSLRPHTLTGHMALYKSVLHHTANVLPIWFLESVGVFVSMINNCEYCRKHHLAGLKRMIDPGRVDEIIAALQSRCFEPTFTKSESCALRYAEHVTIRPGESAETLVEDMRTSGIDDGEILEINQVVAYFAYANRTVSGLGVTIEGDELGLSPRANDDPSDWRHE